MRRTNKEAYFKGIYIPTYLPKVKCWGVETSHGIETGGLSYVADQFCGDSIEYCFYVDADRKHPDHVHASFEPVIEALLKHPETFSIEGFEELYSTQERCVLMNIKESIKQVKGLNRPLTQEEARENRKRIMKGKGFY